jgi:hypothetical protein
MLSRPQTAAPASAAAPKPPAPPCGCNDDPAAGLKQMFVDYFQGRSTAAGCDPATRPVFLRLHGAAHGRFVVGPNLLADLRVGVFEQQSEYPAWVRFSSDLQPGLPDLRGTIGIGIKLFGLHGEKMLDGERNASTHDFLLQNFDVFFTDTARDMCEFTCASLNGKFDEYVAKHPITGQILDEMNKNVDSVLATSYWSVLPFCGCAVRMRAAPASSAPSAITGSRLAMLLYRSTRYRPRASSMHCARDSRLDMRSRRSSMAMTPGSICTHRASTPYTTRTWSTERAITAPKRAGRSTFSGAGEVWVVSSHLRPA